MSSTIVTAANNPLRHPVLQTYKTLLYLGRTYPHSGGYRWFRERLYNAYKRNSGERSLEEVQKGIEKAKYVQREIEMLYYLKKYRALRRMYGDSQAGYPAQVGY